MVLSWCMSEEIEATCLGRMVSSVVSLESDGSNRAFRLRKAQTFNKSISAATASVLKLPIISYSLIGRILIFRKT